MTDDEFRAIEARAAAATERAAAMPRAAWRAEAFRDVAAALDAAKGGAP